MTIERIADATIEPATHQDLLIKGKGFNTGNIMEQVLKVYNQRNYQVKDFAPYLEGSTLKETCHNIWDFVRSNIAYNKDPGGDQWVRRPSRLWADKEGDCKSMSVFTASCLHWLGIEGVFRFVSFDPKKKIPVHVYVVVPDGAKEIVIDCVPQIKYFGQEAAYQYKYDYSMDRLMELAGIDETPRALAPKMYLLLSMMDALVNEREQEAKRNGGWITSERDYDYQLAFARLQNDLKGVGISGIGDATGSAIATLASFTGIPGAGAFASILTNLLSNNPDPNNWRGWTPGDVKQWTINDGDSKQNEAINIISYINAHGLKDIIDSDAFGRNRVTIQQIADKLVRGGFPAQAQALLASGSTNRTNATGGLTNTVNDLNKQTAKSSNTTLLVVGGVVIVGLLLAKKR